MAPPPPAKPLIGPPGVAATVNGQTISIDRVKDLAYKSAGPNVVSRLITITIIHQEAKKQKMTATKADIDAKIAELRVRVKSQNPTQTLEQVMAQSGLSMADLRDNLSTQVELEKMVSKSIPSVRAVHVRHILIKTTEMGGTDPNAKPHTDAEAQALIEKIQGELKAGKSFSDLAKQYTEDPSGKENGGDLPVILPSSPMDPSFLEAALKLKKGEVTPTPIKSMYGLHLIECDSTSDNPTPADKPLFAEALKNYKQQQLGMQMQTYVQQLTKQAKVVNYLEHGVPAETPKKAGVTAKPAKSAAK